MILHKDQKNFDAIIVSISRYFNLSTAIIEKDYYVTLVLFELSKTVPNLIFKGGTSLSKCYKIIRRFSEDIDITLDSEYQSQSKRKNLKYTIIEICNSLGFTLLNEQETKSRKNFNQYKIDYKSKYKLFGLNPQLILETSFIVKSFPNELKKASSIIYDYLKLTENNDLIEYYKLEPFDIRVQTLQRTFIDKIFAICDYYISNTLESKSRHIYDIAKLFDHVKLNDDLKILFNEVREERKINLRCYSAHKDINIPRLLQQIVDENFFKKDYEQTTKKLISESFSYEKAINIIQLIIDSGVFDA